MHKLSTLARTTLALALVAALSGCGKKEAPSRTAKPVLNVTAEVASLQPLSHRISASGTVAAWQDVPVASETGGLQVTAVLVDEGSRVREGQPLIQLDDRVLRAQVRQSQAAVNSAKAILAQNQAALKRAQELHGRGFLAQSALDTAIANQSTAQAQVQTAQAGLGENEAKLSQASVRAPVSGLITARSVVKGQVIQVGTELFRLVRDDQLEMNAQIPEADLAFVRPGMAAEVSGEQGHTIGRVRLVTPQVDPQTRLGLARITLPISSPFRPGNYGTALIDAGETPALAAPEQAIVYHDGRPGIYVLSADNRARFVSVVTGERMNGLVQIAQGLQPGQRIVTQGGGFISDGDKVTVVAPLH